ncbi:unnamed protein product [Cuscuta epithymum]|uniref:Uncharacterized protein n=1 Tax=Cuscuta epithymum TaxID=186058 RepID=A0AAV0G516_9ASTE|nr:unnamed protein product [Cuscuta epithymum]
MIYLNTGFISAECVELAIRLAIPSWMVTIAPTWRPAYHRLIIVILDRLLITAVLTSRSAPRPRCDVLSPRPASHCRMSWVSDRARHPLLDGDRCLYMMIGSALPRHRIIRQASHAPSSYSERRPTPRPHIQTGVQRLVLIFRQASNAWSAYIQTGAQRLVLTFRQAPNASSSYSDRRPAPHPHIQTGVQRLVLMFGSSKHLAVSGSETKGSQISSIGPSATSCSSIFI